MSVPSSWPSAWGQRAIWSASVMSCSNSAQSGYQGSRSQAMMTCRCMLKVDISGAANCVRYVRW